MSYEAKVFRILIASPSDVEEERDIAVKTIQEWNDLNSHERQIVLLPLRWETHTAPEYGKRPQEVINRQMVDFSDLVIGIFWTRIGTPTGVADSGTLEEIDRVASQGKPVMLYFSQVKKDPDSIELEQLQKLRDFKQKTYPKALVENYTSQVEFRDKLSKQIEIQLRNLIVSQSAEIESDYAHSSTNISLEFYDFIEKKNIGQTLTLKSKYLEVKNIDSIPDFEDSADTNRKLKGLNLFDRPNTNYYRDYLEYIVKSSMYRKVNFWLKNNSVIGARDIFLDVLITSNIESLNIESNLKFEIKRPSKERDSSISLSLGDYFQGQEFQIRKNDERWDASIELKALQPKREVVTRQSMLIGAEESGEIDFQIRIYADTLAEPITHKLKLVLEVEKIEINAIDALIENGVLQTMKKD